MVLESFTDVGRGFLHISNMFLFNLFVRAQFDIDSKSERPVLNVVPHNKVSTIW